MIINIYRSSCKAPYILLRLQRNLNFLGRFWKKIRNRVPRKKKSSRSQILPCGQTYLTKLTVAFPNFTYATKKLVKVNEEIKAINKCWWARRMFEEKQEPRITTKYSVDRRIHDYLQNNAEAEQCAMTSVTISNLCSHWFTLWQDFPLFLAPLKQNM